MKYRLNTEILILSPLKTSDGIGGNTIVYESKMALWAYIEQLGVSNNVFDRFKDAKTAYKVIIRLPNNLNIENNDVIEIDNKKYTIVSISDVKELDRRYYKQLTVIRND